MNTKLSLSYKSSSGSAYSDVVLKGAITQEQIKILQNHLYEGDSIIAHQLGLPTPAEQIKEEGYIFPEEEDHVWTIVTSLANETVVPADLLTSETTTTDLSLNDLVEAISDVTWDIDSEHERLGFNEISCMISGSGF